MKILKDLKRYSNGSLLKAIFTIFFGYEFQTIFWYRVAHFFDKIHFSIFSKIIMYWCNIIYSVDIDYRCDIAGGFKLVHGIGIVIGKDVVIEENVTVYQGVTLGGNNGKKKNILGIEREQPYIHSGVNIYSGAIIIGPCEIGENSIIAARAFVSKDVRANTRVYTKCERIDSEII